MPAIFLLYSWGSLSWRSHSSPFKDITANSLLQGAVAKAGGDELQPKNHMNFPSLKPILRVGVSTPGGGG